MLDRRDQGYGDHLADADFEELAMAESESGPAAVTRDYPDWSFHIIHCDGCAVELGRWRRVYALTPARAVRRASDAAFAALAELHESARRARRASPVEYIRNTAGQIVEAILTGMRELTRDLAGGIGGPLAGSEPVPVVRTRGHVYRHRSEHDERGGEQPPEDDQEQERSAVGVVLGWQASEMDAQVLVRSREGETHTRLLVLPLGEDPFDPGHATLEGWSVELQVSSETYGPKVVNSAGLVDFPLPCDPDRLKQARIRLRPDLPVEPVQPREGDEEE